MASRRKSTAAPRPRILEAALATFSARGVEATSIADVAAAAGMSKQALMHHFGTKALLVEGVYFELGQRLRALFPEVAAELVSRARDYAGVIALVAERLAENQQIARFMVHELLSRPEQTVRWLRSEAAPWLGLVVGVIDQDRLRRETAAPGRKAPRRLPHDQIDPDAHVTVLAALMLAVSALVPREDPRWRRRVQAAMLRVMRLGSHLDD